MEFIQQKGKARFYILLSCCAIALLSLGVLIGTILPVRANAETENESAPKIAEPPQQNEALVQEESEPMIYDAYIIQTKFLNCAHTQMQYIGNCAYTKEALEEKYPGCRMTLHETGKPLIQREMAEYCPQHYVLQLHESVLNVEQYDPESETRKIVKTIEAEVQTMPESIRKELEAGIPFETLSQIDEYIENAES